MYAGLKISVRRWTLISVYLLHLHHLFTVININNVSVTILKIKSFFHFNFKLG